MNTTCSLEVPVDSLDSIDEVMQVATGVEICSDLAGEGWTPGRELVESIVSARGDRPVELVCMVRPLIRGVTDGLDARHFQGPSSVIDRCVEAIEMAAACGVDGVGFGLLNEDGTVDGDGCGMLVEHASGLGLFSGFLRMFDLVPCRTTGIEMLGALGFDRVLTAGGHGWSLESASIQERVEVLRGDTEATTRDGHEHGRPPVDIVAGGGVRPSNAGDFLSATPKLHSSCRKGGVLDPGLLDQLGDCVRAQG
ncbi:MAG: hypothetical protein CMJ32_05315 [Phycisphaerae bacterium]|nr:hypothetical protein [Phycisphaerae bacterium]